MPLVPTAPGAIVQQPADEWLLSLQGHGELEIRRALNHETVPVRLRTSEILRRHCAIYGMTGAGKSNGLKVLLRSLLKWLRERNNNGESPSVDLRVIVVDTQGEYASVASQLDPGAQAQAAISENADMDAAAA